VLLERDWHHRTSENPYSTGACSQVGDASFVFSPVFFPVSQSGCVTLSEEMRPAGGSSPNREEIYRTTVLAALRAAWRARAREQGRSLAAFQPKLVDVDVDRGRF
jgi:hypothetical protein